ncbi:TetR/AcrR family transcriptional regulator [Phytoactinopolyspora limicola]|uniref:TetR/AcrR family transcriptional regulator n=1 Tax=Phytoactinopolyspora limicola TaxID=2715536 RepID=UPI001A9CAA14|nr:TetR/AcrR family transcriptional regulator [Phytoactinopolyspora limicola]
MGTRDLILDAAAQIMRDDGITRATTKEIARRAGFSEATLYKHFADKTELFVAVLAERAPGLAEVLATLGDRVGRGSVATTLSEVARSALLFYDETFTMAAGVFADRQVLQALRADLHRIGAGPEGVNHALTSYLTKERAAGRVRADLDPTAASSLLLGACLQRAFLRHFYGRELEDADSTATALVETLIRGIGTSH